MGDKHIGRITEKIVGGKEDLKQLIIHNGCGLLASTVI